MKEIKSYLQRNPRKITEETLEYNKTIKYPQTSKQIKKYVYLWMDF